MTNHYTLGKVDYNKSGRPNCEAAITWSFDDGRFSMQAEIWNPRKTDIYCGGQCVDEVVIYFPTDTKAQRMLSVWKRWHLNGMRAGSPAQEEELRRHEYNPRNDGPHYKWAQRILAKADLNPDAAYVRNGKPYKYGTAWLLEEIPTDVKAEIVSWSTRDS